MDRIIFCLRYHKEGAVGTEVIQFHLGPIIFAHQVEAGDVDMVAIISPGSNLDPAIYRSFWVLHCGNEEVIAIVTERTAVHLKADGGNPDDLPSGQYDCIVRGVLQLVVCIIWSVFNL